MTGKQAHTPLPEQLDYFVGNANGRGLIRIEGYGTGEHIASASRGKESEAHIAEIVRRYNAAPTLLAERDALRAALLEAEGALRGAALELDRAQEALHTAHPSVRACEIGLGLGSKAEHYRNKADEAASVLRITEARTLLGQGNPTPDRDEGDR